jgi:hypothetical protein
LYQYSQDVVFSTTVATDNAGVATQRIRVLPTSKSQFVTIVASVKGEHQITFTLTRDDNPPPIVDPYRNWIFLGIPLVLVVFAAVVVFCVCVQFFQHRKSLLVPAPVSDNEF